MNNIALISRLNAQSKIKTKINILILKFQFESKVLGDT